jgi:hypothetical protein
LVHPPELGRSKREGRGANEVGGGIVAPLKPLRSDWWGHGRHTAATVRPRVDDGLRPVGHAALTD